MSRVKPVNCNSPGLIYQQTSLQIRRMEDADVARVMEIELKSYEFPWTEGIFKDCIRVGYRCRVLEQTGEMVGYAVMSVGAREAHVLNVCIRRDVRGKGHGRMLMAELIDQARLLGAEMMFLEVRASNVIARTLYNKLGFNEVGARTGYYPARVGREDALILARNL